MKLMVTNCDPGIFIRWMTAVPGNAIWLYGLTYAPIQQFLADTEAQNRMFCKFTRKHKPWIKQQPKSKPYTCMYTCIYLLKLLDSQ